MATLTTTRSGMRLGGTRPRTLLGRAISLLAFHRTRASLAHLDDAMLSDIGVTREQALKEAKRPLWDVPPTWRA